MSTPHNSAEKGQIAKTVLMPGDPLRAKYIAENFLENPVLVNNVRGIGGYTGTYKGAPVTVMASGMGMPSIGIYSYELYKFYDVENIIRVGSAGAYDPDLHIYDVVLADAAWSESTFAKTQCGYEGDTTYPSESLNGLIKEAAAECGITLHEGTIHSSDVFYRETKDYMDEVINVHHCAAVEMESFALFANAKTCGRNAACLVTISDSMVTHEDTTPEERERSFNDMIKLALETARIAA